MDKIEVKDRVLLTKESKPYSNTMNYEALLQNLKTWNYLAEVKSIRIDSFGDIMLEIEVVWIDGYDIHRKEIINNLNSKKVKKVPNSIADYKKVYGVSCITSKFDGKHFDFQIELFKEIGENLIQKKTKDYIVTAMLFTKGGQGHYVTSVTRRGSENDKEFVRKLLLAKTIDDKDEVNKVMYEKYGFYTLYDKNNRKAITSIESLNGDYNKEGLYVVRNGKIYWIHMFGEDKIMIERLNLLTSLFTLTMTIDISKTTDDDSNSNWYRLSKNSKYENFKRFEKFISESETLKVGV